MNFLFITDPLKDLLPHHDTSVALMVAAQHLGQRVLSCTVADLFVEQGQAGAWVQPVTLDPQATPYVQQESPERVNFNEIPVIFMRKDPPVDRQYLLATYLLDQVDPTKTLVINRSTGLRQANEKMYALNFAPYLPPTTVTSQVSEVQRFLEIHEKAVLKPLDGKGGEGIFLLQAADRNLKALVEVSTQGGQIPVMIQRYLPESRQGDKRILVLGGQPLGAVLRVPAADDVRGNLRVGGRAEVTTITPHEHALCEALAPRLLADGLYFVGLDVIGEYLTEINVTSPTGIQEMPDPEGLAQTVIRWAIQFHRHE